MTRIGVVGGQNPHPMTFGRRQWLGPYAHHFMGNNKSWPSGNKIPVNPTYGQGAPMDGYWTEHGTGYWDITGNNIHSEEGITVTQKSGAQTESWDAVFCGCSPGQLSLSTDAICPIFPGNNYENPGFTAMSFDWERRCIRSSSHRNRIRKVGFMYRSGENSVRFHDCSFLDSHTPKATGDTRILSYRVSGDNQTQRGTIYCPVRQVDNYPELKINGVHNVVGIGIQFVKEGGFNPEQSTQVGTYTTVKNLCFHTAGNKEIILPRKQVYPVHQQHPTGRDEIYVY